MSEIWSHCKISRKQLFDVSLISQIRASNSYRYIAKLRPTVKIQITWVEMKITLNNKLNVTPNVLLLYIYKQVLKSQMCEFHTYLCASTYLFSSHTNVSLHTNVCKVEKTFKCRSVNIVSSAEKCTHIPAIIGNFQSKISAAFWKPLINFKISQSNDSYYCSTKIQCRTVLRSDQYTGKNIQ